MTTQLVWKSFEESNRFYTSVLGYQLPIVIDVELEQVVTKKSKTTVLFFSFYLLLMTICLICAMKVIFGACISKTIEISLSYLLINIFFLALLTLCLCLVLILIRDRIYFTTHFLSALFNYEKHLLGCPNFSKTKSVFAQLFSNG